MDSLANALSTSGRYSRALEYYEEFLSGLESVDDVSNRWHAEAAILYMMSRTHRMQRKDIAAEVDTLENALLAIQATKLNTSSEWQRKELLD